MSKATLALGLAIATLVAVPAASLINVGFTRASSTLAQASAPADRQKTIEVFVGALCSEGRMIVGSSFADLQDHGCRDTWVQELTEEQVMGLTR